MKKFVMMLVLLLSTAAFMPSSQQKTINRVSGSVVRITGTHKLTDPFQIFFNGGEEYVHYVCSGFVIAPQLVLTANHCLSESMEADGLPVTILNASEELDLGLLDVKTDKPALELRTDTLSIGEEVMARGYGYGYNVMVTTFHKVTVLAVKPNSDMPVCVLYLSPFIGGMSGGPVVDNKGRVVGIVQWSATEAGFGVNALALRFFLSGFVE